MYDEMMEDARNSSIKALMKRLYTVIAKNPEQAAKLIDAIEQKAEESDVEDVGKMPNSAEMMPAMAPEEDEEDDEIKKIHGELKDFMNPKPLPPPKGAVTIVGISASKKPMPQMMKKGKK